MQIETLTPKDQPGAESSSSSTTTTTTTKDVYMPSWRPHTPATPNTHCCRSRPRQHTSKRTDSCAQPSRRCGCSSMSKSLPTLLRSLALIRYQLFTQSPFTVCSGRGHPQRGPCQNPRHRRTNLGPGSALLAAHPRRLDCHTRTLYTGHRYTPQSAHTIPSAAPEAIVPSTPTGPPAPPVPPRPVSEVQGGPLHTSHPPTAFFGSLQGSSTRGTAPETLGDGQQPQGGCAATSAEVMLGAMLGRTPDLLSPQHAAATPYADTRGPISL